MLKIAGAPVNFGVFELTPETGVELIGPDAMCELLAEEGYQGIDLGPVGFLGRGTELRDRLARNSLELAGGWMDFAFSNTTLFHEQLRHIDETLDIFVTAAETNPELPPLPTLACMGTEQRQAHPGGSPELQLSPTAFAAFAENVNLAANRVRARGLEPTFHHHACTFVETPEEIDQLLNHTDIGLTFDTGHLILGGGDPLNDLKRWRNRINHVHLKDAKRDVLETVVKNRGSMRDVWEGGAFVPFGSGDVNVTAVMNTLIDGGYQGWIVVEQDIIPNINTNPDQYRNDHRTNREALRPWL